MLVFVGGGDGYTSEDTERWESARNAVIRKIEEAKAKANNYTTIAMPGSSSRYIGEPYEEAIDKSIIEGYNE